MSHKYSDAAALALGAAALGHSCHIVNGDVHFQAGDEAMLNCLQDPVFGLTEALTAYRQRGAELHDHPAAAAVIAALEAHAGSLSQEDLTTILKEHGLHWDFVKEPVVLPIGFVVAGR